eukprot:Hpha_TRINITY_DN34252_c0_g1::TRINITY_DN34252_c0_g1_i1::g.34364::m.34364
MDTGQGGGGVPHWSVQLPPAHPLDRTFIWIVVFGSLPASGIIINLLAGDCLLSRTGKRGWRMVIAVALITLWQFWVYVIAWHAPRLSDSADSADFLQNFGSTAPRMWAGLVRLSERDQAMLAVYVGATLGWVSCWFQAIRADTTSKELSGELRRARERFAEAEGDEDKAEAERILGGVKQRHRALGAHGCQTLGGEVVPGFDHYCPLINNAVGSKNRAVFVAALFFELCAGAVLLIEGIPVAQQLLGVKQPTADQWQILVGVVLCSHVNFAIGGLLLLQLVALAFGTTTVGLQSRLGFT